jgi:hypothetical protein
LLVANEAEAVTVRRIFDDLVQERSATMMVRQLALGGMTTKTGRKFCKQDVYKILHPGCTWAGSTTRARTT